MDEVLSVNRVGPWVFLQMKDGSVLAQFYSSVNLLSTGEIASLLDVDDNYYQTLEHKSKNGVVIRSIRLNKDGSVECDSNALSLNGIPSEPFEIFSSFINSIGRFVTEP